MCGRVEIRVVSVCGGEEERRGLCAVQRGVIFMRSAGEEMRELCV